MWSPKGVFFYYAIMEYVNHTDCLELPFSDSATYQPKNPLGDSTLSERIFRNCLRRSAVLYRAECYCLSRHWLTVPSLSTSGISICLPRASSNHIKVIVSCQWGRIRISHRTLWKDKANFILPFPIPPPPPLLDWSITLRSHKGHFSSL